MSERMYDHRIVPATYLSIYRTNISHERAAELYDMPRLPLAGVALAYIYSFPLFFCGTKEKFILKR